MAGSPENITALSQRIAPVISATDELRSSVDTARLHVVIQKGRLFNIEHPEVPVLHDSGRFLLVDMDPEEAREIGTDKHCFAVRPAHPDDTVFLEREAPTVLPEITQREQDLVAQVDPVSFERTLQKLAAFTNRHSLSDDFNTSIALLEGQMRNFGYETETQQITIRNRTSGQGVGPSANLIARRKGTGPNPRGIVIVNAHLDSVNSQNTLDPSLSAPGADDNGSGSAGVLEIARIMATAPSDDDLMFILYGGEEQGLYGSTEFVAALKPADRRRVRAVINLDMIGVLNSPPASVLLEGAPVSQHVIDGLATQAAMHTSLRVRTSLEPFASDHMPFLDLGMPAVLAIEGDDTQNVNIHTPGDTLDQISAEYAAEILRMIVGYVGSLVLRKESS